MNKDFSKMNDWFIFYLKFGNLNFAWLVMICSNIRTKIFITFHWNKKFNSQFFWKWDDVEIDIK